jgi:ArsR family transcriptional regulator
MKTHELFVGLADPIRMRIVVLLLERELCVCDLMAVLQLPQSTVSRHMSRMKSSGLVDDRREGKWVHYRLVRSSSLDDLRAFLKRNFAGADPHRRDLAKLRRYLSTKRCRSISAGA